MASSTLQQQSMNALKTVNISRKKSSKNDSRTPLQNALDSQKGFITDSSRLELEKLLNLPDSGVFSRPTSTMRPGDTYNGTSSRRPLGLLPSKRKRDSWKQLGVFIRHTVGGVTGIDDGSMQQQQPQSVVGPYNHSAMARSNLNSSKVVRLIEHRKYPMSTPVHDHSRHISHPSSGAIMAAEDDPEYLSTLAQCNLKEYTQPMATRQRDHPLQHVIDHADQTLSGNSHTIGWRAAAGVGGKLQTSANLFQGKKNLEYLSFFQPANLNKRTLFTDCRNAKDYVPCERCALRGTRCRHCKAIRTGGGYIILDGLEDTNGLMGDNGSTRFSDYGSRQYLRSSSRRRNRSGVGDSGDEGLYFDELGRETGEDGFDFDDNGGGRRRGGKRERDGVDEGGGDWSPDRTLSSRGRGGHGSINNGGPDSRGSNGHKGINGIDENEDGLYGISGRLNTSGGNDRNIANGGQRNGDSLGETDDNDGTGRGTRGGHSRSGGGGNGLNYDQDEDMDNTMGMEPRSKRSSKRDNGDGAYDKAKFGKGGVEKDKTHHGKGSSSDDHGGSHSGRGSSLRRQGDLNGYADNTDRGNSTHRVGFVGGDDDPPSTNQSMFDLMRFKSKRDKTRAKSCTLRELKGIDPLDYLAKYCIIDQDKVPHYQRVFENVDQDEDNEISVMELDFALKAVNYNLISDAELVYVNKVLELTGRYALNFQLFTLVAALSEKVVSLDDMVKRLVNTMDFEALETKMKKCKELFYLLANREEDEEDGVVTSAALGIELHAGGLTQEHVDYVIAHLDQDQKGKIEFLDYLVYVPLFVEIHGNISSNPLDFSRTK